MRILVADDSPVLRRMLEATLTQWHYELVTAASGSEAWEKLQSDPTLEMAILDWMMPGMDGIEVCRRLRERVGGRFVYVILLTSRDATADVVAGLGAGANDYIRKPFDQLELQARVSVGERVVQLQADLTRRVAELEQALSQVVQLQGLLPIRAYCKRIRDDTNYWEQLETYVSTHSDARFSHGICPDCFARVSDELENGGRNPPNARPL